MIAPEIIVSRLRAMNLLTPANRIARAHFVSIEDVCGRQKFARITRARHVLWAYVRQARNLSYPELGALFDVDHTTVMHGVRRAGVHTARPAEVRAALRVI